MSSGTGGWDVARVDWEKAHAAALPLISNATRYRVPGADPGVEISVLDWGGSGELVLLHHANGFCAATLGQVAASLSEWFRVVSIDARGHGDSTPVGPGGDPDPYDWDRLTKDANCAIKAILEKTEHDRVALAIGHSFGGALLLRAAAAAPETIERLLLCDPVILPPMTPEQQAEHSKGPGLAAATRKRRDHFPSFEAAYNHCRSRGLFADFTPESLALYIGQGMAETDDGQITLKCHREVEAAIFDGGPSSSVVGSVDIVAAKVMFVHAKRGNFVAEFYEEIASQMSDASVQSCDLGHLFPLEEPDRVLAFVEEIFF